MIQRCGAVVEEDDANRIEQSGLAAKTFPGLRLSGCSGSRL
jgi:hypothetical protein